MYQKIRKRTEGFTIIEVLIVLAIAGLILLIVFIAVPALQRNARNTQRKNDIAGILGIVTEFSNNNAGQLPTTATLFLKAAVVGGGAGTQQATVNTSYYDSASGMTLTMSATTGAVTNPNNSDQVVLVRGAACDGTTGNSIGGAGVSGRSVVALFTLEGGARQCQAS